MELVYLWVEKYKNIEKQGFNFSPRFECDYDEDTNKLTIDEKKDYVSIFPNNINITAIVGENGSGKSKLIEILDEVLRRKIFGQDYDIGYDYILIINSGEIHCFSNIQMLKLNVINCLVHKSNIRDKLVIRPLIYSSNNNTIYGSRVSIQNKQIAIKMAKILVLKNNFNLSSFMYLPNRVTIMKCDFEILFNTLVEKSVIGYPLSLSNIIDGNKLEKNDIDYYKFKLLFLLKKNRHFILEKFDINIIDEKCQNEDILNKKDFLEYFIEGTSKNKSYYNIESLTELEKSIYFDKYMDFFEFNFIDEQNRSLEDLSHGEKIIFSQFLNIYEHSMNDDMIFLFDEPEISLHPKWQKEYIFELTNLLKIFNKRCHFIFASHSPFLLSDLPNDNIIFLKKDIKTKKCLNITKKTKLYTFGANIHTLLSDGFFMSDGLMGEFAKGKIEEIKKFYQIVTKFKKRNKLNVQRQEKLNTYYSDKKEKFEQIHSIIGEPFLKTIIGNYLNELHLIFSDDKILIDKRLEELDKEKIYLKSLRND